MKQDIPSSKNTYINCIYALYQKTIAQLSIPCLVTFCLLLTPCCISYYPFSKSFFTEQTSDDAVPCLYDPVSQTYKQCFHVTADGKCAHFGAACIPESALQSASKNAPCLYDAQSGSYKECYHVMADGSCAHFGAICNTASSSSSQQAVPCLYDAESGSYKECFHVTADGTCAHFGGVCIP